LFIVCFLVFLFFYRQTDKHTNKQINKQTDKQTNDA